MAYGRVHRTQHVCTLDGAPVSHSAELVRGDSFAREMRPPHPPLRGTFSPRGEGTVWLALEDALSGQSALLGAGDSCAHRPQPSAFQLDLDEGVIEGVGVDDVVVHAGLAGVRDAELEVGEALFARRRHEFQPAVAQRHHHVVHLVHVLAGLGAGLVALPMDEKGLVPDALERELAAGPPPAFLDTVPTFQNPTGRTLAAERRRRIVELAVRHDLLVLEDDPYGLVRYEGEPPPLLFDLEGGERVVYTSSFSKTVAPGVRVGYFVLPEGLAAAIEEVAVSTYISPPALTQATVHELIRRGAFEPNLERVRGLLRTRRDAMLAALGESSPARRGRPEAAFLWVTFPEGVDAGELLVRALDAGVAFVQGTDFFPAGSGDGTGAARFAFSFESPEQITEGVARLAELL